MKQTTISKNNLPLFKVVFTINDELFEKNYFGKGVDRVKQNVYIEYKSDNPLNKVVILEVDLIN